MEVFQTDQFYIFLKYDKSLWWNRITSEFTIKPGWDLSSVNDIECIGITQGIIGTIALPNVYEPHLVIIKEALPVGVLYASNLVYKIKSICILSGDETETNLTACSKHSRSNKSTPTHTASASATAVAGSKGRLFEGNKLINKIGGAVKSAGNTLKSTTQQAAAIASNQVKSSVGIRDPTRIEKRITEELHKIFDDSDSFYFCPDDDLTNNLQRHTSHHDQDERFFWNKHMIKDILDLGDRSWVLPVIQGFVQVESCVIGNECLTLALISRRSRHRAGTRYKRRGVDTKGNCANYVETEQILTFRHHQLSFTQVRGSVPIYWSQPGYKYRPPPRLDKGVEETQEAFENHFNREISIYNRVCIVNLVEQNGKEKLIGDAYAKHVVKYNNENLIYVTFDFHDNCRGMHFENVSTLVEALAPEAGLMNFHWHDAKGVICNQKSVFRVNCMDCLDRTNVVQTAIGKVVLESQLVKFGLSTPYTPLPEQLKVPFMVLWANNGDIISRQYAGTNALKGDYTRTGERKISGMMKDGMNSANRYYLARFKDSSRQATIDLMLGNPVSAESLSALGGQTVPVENDNIESAEQAKLLVDDCRRLLLGSSQYPVGSWGLIDADPSTGDISETEVDTVLLLTDEFYIVADYDSHLEKIARFEKIPLRNVTLIELGMYQQAKLFQGSAPAFLCLRLNYSINGLDGYFHMFRSANIRFFNNTTYVIKTQEELMESLMSIIEMFRIALDSVGNPDVRFTTGGVLQRRKSKNPLLDVPKGMPRNLSESQLLQISSKAFSNVAGQFSKLGQTLIAHKHKASAENNSIGAVTLQTAHGAESIETGLEAEKIYFSVGPSSDNEETDNSIYKSDVAWTMDDSQQHCSTNNDFLPSVGIVMSSNCTSAQEATEQPLQAKDNLLKNSEDVLAISISSVMDHVTLPTGLLENVRPVRPITPTPQICVQDDSEHLSSTSSKQTNTSVQTELHEQRNAMKQIKTMTNPLSKLAKGVQNLGLNLDPRKIATKSTVTSPTNASGDQTTLSERQAVYKAYLVELWQTHDCKTKLIAL